MVNGLDTANAVQSWLETLGPIASLQHLTQGCTLYRSISLALILDDCGVTAQTVHLFGPVDFATLQL